MPKDPKVEPVLEQSSQMEMELDPVDEAVARVEELTVALRKARVEERRARVGRARGRS